MKNLEIILDEQGKSEERRKSIDNVFLRKAKIKIVAYKGGFDGLASEEEIRLAKLRGVMPKGFELHHIKPLCSKTCEISLENMVIMDSASHKLLHRLYDRQLRHCRVGMMACVYIPDFDVNKVSTKKTFDPDFLRYLKEKERE